MATLELDILKKVKGDFRIKKDKPVYMEHRSPLYT